MADQPPVEVSNETAFPIQVGAVAEVVSAVLRSEATRGRVAVAFLAEAEMAGLNGRYRGLPESTDVLSFPAEDELDDDWPEPEEDFEDEPHLGDVAVCPAVAERYAAEDGISLDVELRRLLVHGVLHLLGWDHEVDQGEMRAREEEVLGEVSGLAGSLLEDRDE